MVLGKVVGHFFWPAYTLFLQQHVLIREAPVGASPPLLSATCSSNYGLEPPKPSRDLAGIRPNLAAKPPVSAPIAYR